MNRAVVLADTHMKRGSTRRLPARAYDLLGETDLVLHAGDVVHVHVLDELGRFAPVHAVLGNNDDDLHGVLPETRVVEIDGVRVAMIHDSGARAGRARRMHRLFPDADVVVFGHSHLPLSEPGIDGQLLFNPGSPTERRRAPTRTLGVLECEAGTVTRAEIIDL